MATNGNARSGTQPEPGAKSGHTNYRKQDCVTTTDLLQAAQGHWPSILPALGVSAEYLKNRHGPCPGCGGRDRFRFDDRNGRGGFVCGSGGETLTGDGFDLLEHVNGWTRQESFRAVSDYLGMSANLPPRQRPQRPVVAARTASTQRSTADYARELWARASRENEHVGSHNYAAKKGITWAAGAGRGQASGTVIGKQADCLLIPIRDICSDEVVAVQCISANGAKQTFGSVRGHAFVCGNTLDKTIPWFVCEGWADAVAQTVAEHYGPARLVIVEDAP